MDMYRNASPLNFTETTEAMGLTGLIDERTGALNVSKLPQVPKFLNRLLPLTTPMQHTVFEHFFTGLE